MFNKIKYNLFLMYKDIIILSRSDIDIPAENYPPKLLKLVNHVSPKSEW